MADILPFPDPRKPPVLRLIDDIQAEQEARHAWLFRAGEQVRRWKAEDAAAGQPWDGDAA